MKEVERQGSGLMASDPDGFEFRVREGVNERLRGFKLLLLLHKSYDGDECG